MKTGADILSLTLSLALAGQCAFAADKPFAWPNGARAAVNLQYDDAMDSQLENAIPVLDKYGLKGSFYLTMSSSTLSRRLAEWRAAAAHGHELGNHTLFHQCSRKVPGREWVTAENDLDQVSAAQLAAQIRVGNILLHAIDGNTERTFAAPCGESSAGGENYLPAIQREFVAIKSASLFFIADTLALDPRAVIVVAPANVSGERLIDIAKQAAARGTMANFVFHGIGGDSLVVSREAHEELLMYLAANRNVYWTDTFINIMKYVKEQQNQ